MLFACGGTGTSGNRSEGVTGCWVDASLLQKRRFCLQIYLTGNPWSLRSRSSSAFPTYSPPRACRRHRLPVALLKNPL